MTLCSCDASIITLNRRECHVCWRDFHTCACVCVRLRACFHLAETLVSKFQYRKTSVRKTCVCMYTKLPHTMAFDSKSKHKKTSVGLAGKCLLSVSFYVCAHSFRILTCALGCRLCLHSCAHVVSITYMLDSPIYVRISPFEWHF
jgi:hypothetical protein